MPVFRASIPPIAKVSMGDKILCSSLIGCLIVFGDILHRHFNADHEGGPNTDFDGVIQNVYFGIYMFMLFCQVMTLVLKYVVFRCNRRKMKFKLKQKKRPSASHYFYEWFTCDMGFDSSKINILKLFESDDKPPK